jgi:peptidoglycan hydrolase CwlO-like protein
MGSEIGIALIGLFCTIVSSIVTFLLTRRKYNSEVEAQQIQNMKDAFETYKGMMEETVTSQDKKIERLQRENDSLRNQIGQLQSQVLNILIGKKLGVDMLPTEQTEE